MTRAALITRVVKPVLYLTALLPLAWLLYALLAGLVMGDQVKFMQHVTGDTVLTSLMLTLAVTPLRRLTGWNELIRVRRLIGLTAFWYACLHLSTYLVFDQSLDVGEILADIRKHPWVLVGFAGFLCLVPLAITSTNGWIRRLGGKRWARLHRLVYAAAIAGVLHYWWLVKKDLTYPILYGIVLLLLLLPRLWWAADRARARRVPVRGPVEADPA
ncbi:MAG TPA: protein-methionine-sulfoxide reductase heme-binding subunit MsrQ [Gemmatimonadales bacterium]|jgi:sulfoxide reductase heme-binding subunit YedZ|nr:protein-methionine-sulfoxide reductase heme-binding subunit MsrQ [Gemmatimonadales bacterium]